MATKGSGEQVRAPATAVEKAYIRSLQARQNYIEVGSVVADDGTLDDLHAELHASTMGWYEALYPHMHERPGEVGDYWHEAPLWPTERATESAPYCPSCELVFQTEAVSVDDICVECGDTYLVERPVPATDDDGRDLYEWTVGLKSLESWYRETETTTERSGTFRPKTKTVEIPHRLRPEVLFRIARYLDKAAEEMDLLANTSEALPLGEL